MGFLHLHLLKEDVLGINFVLVFFDAGSRLWEKILRYGSEFSTTVNHVMFHIRYNGVITFVYRWVALCSC